MPHMRTPSLGSLAKFQAGGSIGILSPEVTQSNPIVGSYYQSFSQMSPEQLQQFAAMAGPNSQMGQLAHAALMQKSILGAASPQYQSTGGGGITGAIPSPSAPMQQAEQQDSVGGIQPVSTPLQQSELQNMAGAKHGGRAKRAPGGGVPMEFADLGRMEDTGSAHYGLLHSSVPGRTDRIATSPAADSFVVPADVVSGLGEGNTLSGAHVLDIMLHTGPYGTPLPRLSIESHNVHPVSMSLPFSPQSRGGVTGEHHRQEPIIVAGGEYVVPPEALKRLGKGDIEKGHRIMRALCKKVREHTVTDIKKMPEPVK